MFPSDPPDPPKPSTVDKIFGRVQSQPPRVAAVDCRTNRGCGSVPDRWSEASRRARDRSRIDRANRGTWRQSAVRAV